MALKIIAGQTWQTKQNGFLSVVRYNGSKSVDVLFPVTGYRTNTRSDAIRDGRVKDLLRPIANNIGYIGCGKYTSRVNGIKEKSYEIWRGILDRCYNDNRQAIQPTYTGCSMDKSWHNYQVFAEWYDRNYIDGLHLDKDILVNENKSYSPDTCVFVTQSMNNLFNGIEKIGCNRLPSGNYRASVSINGEVNHFGVYADLEDAIDAQKTHKAAEIVRQALLPTTNPILFTPLLDRAESLLAKQIEAMA